MLSRLLEINNLIIAVASLVLSVYATSLVLRFRHELSLSEQVANVPEFLNKRYSDRKFQVPKNARACARGLLILKDARKYIKDLEKEKKLVEADWLKEGTVENAFAYQVSLALQNVGIMILSGALPIKIVLPSVAAIVVEDWNRCYKLVNEELRSPELTLITPKETTAPIHFARRHAEWLAYAAAIYLQRKSRGERRDQALFAFGEAERIDFDESEERIRKREYALRKSEPALVSDKTSKEINDFLYDP